MRSKANTIALARNLRRTLSVPEILLWQDLRRGPLRIGRQHPVGPYVVDFFYAPGRLAIEIDGAAHDHPDRVAHDAARDAWLRGLNITVLRFNAIDVLDPGRRADVIATIVAAAAPPPPPSVVPLPRFAGEDR